MTTATPQVPLPRPAPDRPAARAGGSGSDPIGALARRLLAACRDAVDVDEVAAVLEADGVNDRVAAREYGRPSVFHLAAELLERARELAVEVPVPAVSIRRWYRGAPPWLVGPLIRAMLYLTPLLVALGAAGELRGVPVLATTGTLMLGWTVGQALALLGYGVLHRGGVTGVARLLGVGFVVVTLLWCGVLALAGVPVRGLVVAVAQLALFAATVAALVTGRERWVLAGALPCWAAAGALALGYGDRAVTVLLAGLGALLATAYQPAFRRGGTWCWPPRSALPSTVPPGVVGAGQALLFVLVVLGGQVPGAVIRAGVPDGAMVPVDALPLLIGVPLMEVLVLWHQRRVADAWDSVDSRAEYQARLARIVLATSGILAVPVALAGGAAAAGWSGADLPISPVLESATLVAALYAQSLVLAANRRPGFAALVVWWPAAVLLTAGCLARSYAVAPLLTSPVPTLLAAGLSGLPAVAVLLRDPECYR